MGIYQNLLQQLELDHGLGIHSIERVTDATRSQRSQHNAPVAQAIPDVPSDLSASEQLASIAQHISTCTRCPLHHSHSDRDSTSTPLAGSGATQPTVVFIGDTSGTNEQQHTQLLNTASSTLLDKMIAAMGLTADEVFLTNILKCRTPASRQADTAEITCCSAWLEQQLSILKPQIICTLGNTALQALSGNATLGMSTQRGKMFQWHGINVIPTFHPDYLQRNPQAKKPCWEDLQLLMETIGRPVTT